MPRNAEFSGVVTGPEPVSVGHRLPRGIGDTVHAHGQEFRREADRQGARQFAVKLRNLSNGRACEFLLAVSRGDQGIRISYATGLKSETRIDVERSADGSRLVMFSAS